MAKEPLTVPVQVRLTAEEKQVFSDAAAMRALNLSTWIRLTLREQATADFEGSGQKAPFPEGRMRKQRTKAELEAAPKAVVLAVTPSTPERNGTSVACVLAEDPSRPAVVPAGGQVHPDGRIFDRDGGFVGTAVLQTHAHRLSPVSRETIPGVIHSVNISGVKTRDIDDVAFEAMCEAAGVDPKKPKDDFALDDEPAAPPARGPHHEIEE